MTSKRAFYMFLVQVIAMQLLLAENSNSQRLENIKVTINVERATLEEIFEKLEEKTEFIFGYNKQIISKNEKLSFDYKKEGLNKILKNISKDTGLKFRMINNTISVTKKESRKQKPVTEEKADISISGKVLDENSQGLPGVNITVKGLAQGALTDIEGNFKISVPDGSAVLVFSYVGYIAQEVTVGSQTSINISMELDAQQLDELVVTALGIEREASTLTYAQQTVDGDEITKARDINFLNSLSGRTAGVEIKKSSGGPGGSTRVLLRGDKSLTGDSQPLFVIDGIPMANNRGGQPGMWGGVDGGDGMSQINPDDIESISVLKGSNAAALYGSQGANGVVIITTKKGKSGAAKVQFSSGFTFESVLLKPDLQYKYGAVGGIKESWDTNPGNYADNYVDDFFRTGTNRINSVSISGGTDKTQTYFSYANVDAKGIMQNNTYDRNNLTFKQSTKLLNDKLKVSSSVMLSQEKAENRPAAGYYLNALTGLYRFPRERDYKIYKDNPTILDPDRNVEVMNWFVVDHHQSNPWFILEGQPSVNQTKRVISSLNLDYEISDKVSLSVRGNIDFADKLNETQYASGGNTTNIHPNGAWNYSKFTDQLTYTDAILKYNNNFEDFSLGVIAGTSYQKTTYGKGVSVNTGTNGLLYANEFYFQNLPQVVAVNSTLTSNVIKQGLFVNTTFGFKDMLYFDFSGRTDWASTLIGTGNENYFYPAVGLTGIISEMFSMPEPISFAKVRVSLNRVGLELPWNYIIPSNTVDGASGGVNRGTIAPGTELKPEIITTKEFGTNWRFLDDRIGFDFTYYNITSKDQFLEVAALAGSPYNTRVINIGEINNKGIEIIADATPIFTTNFKWKTTLNFSKNVNTVVSANPDNPDNFISTGSSEGYEAKFKAGGSIGDIYTLSFLRDDQGRIMLENGVPLKTATEDFDLNYRGNLNPVWSLGWTNSLDYKNFSLNFIVNGKFGGKAVSKTEAMLDEAGVSQRTADDRDQGFTTINAVQDGATVTQIVPEDYYRTIGGRNGIMEPYVYSRTNVRLTQMSLSYNTKLTSLALPVSFSIVGQNLLFLYIDAPFDPELAMSTNRNSQSLDNFNVPATRTIGFNINISF
ncbi:SusC/RagA family TonB-linked outer membrane protein [Reichenbachiella sp. MALMAid0571]|uniref:SusC/RagA family TonB-linked outer membrane protein n=1 Tax=Reichenbachiella sp. MALMAid0571 TaxID=3143939 RepID=UPI0032E0152A